MTTGSDDTSKRVLLDGAVFKPLGGENFCSATTLPGNTALPFVISTEAQRSGEISVRMLFLGNMVDLRFFPGTHTVCRSCLDFSG
jgi:hypothetical protein